MKETKLVNVRVPLDIRNWLDEYLERKSYGANFSEKFNNMLLEMKRLDEKQNIDFVNLESVKQAAEEKQKAEQLAEWGTFENSDICVRFPHTYRLNPADVNSALCVRCKTQMPEAFKACRMLRLEQSKK